MIHTILVWLSAIGLTAAGFIVGWYWGVYKERQAWNDLIEKGIVPRPYRRSM